MSNLAGLETVASPGDPSLSDKKKGLGSLPGGVRGLCRTEATRSDTDCAWGLYPKGPCQAETPVLGRC